MPTITEYATSVEITAGTIFDDPQRSNYKRWDNLENLKTSNGVAYCRNPSTASSPLIAGRNGTYNRPAPIDFTGFDFSSITSNTNYDVKTVTVRFKQQKFINNGYYPSIGGATVTLLGTGQSKTADAVPTTETETTVTFNNVTKAQLLSSNFGLRIAYPSNTSTTPGRIILKDVKIDVVYDTTLKFRLAVKGSKNPTLVGEEFNITFDVTKQGTSSRNQVPMVIKLPSCLELVQNVSTNETITITNGNILWKRDYAGGTVNASLTLRVVSVAPATDGQVKITSSIDSVEFVYKVTVKPLTIKVSTTLYKNKIPVIQHEVHDYTFTLESNDPVNNIKRAVFKFTGSPACNIDRLLEAENVINANTSLNSTTGVRTVEFTYNYIASGLLSVPVRLRWDESNENTFTCEIYDSSNSLMGTYTLHFIVRPEEYGALGYTYIKIPDKYLLDMADGVNYTVGTHGKVILANNSYPLEDNGENLRIGVYNGDPFFIQNEVFLEDVIWATNMATVQGVDQFAQFTFNSEYGVYLVYSHQYIDDPMATLTTYNFTEPYIAETGLINSQRAMGQRGIIPHPVQAFLGNGDYAVADIPQYLSTVEVGLAKWDDGGLFEEDIAVQGLIIQFDYITDKTVLVEAIIYCLGETGTRTIVLNKGQGVATVGSVYDIFGFNIRSLSDDINRMELRLKYTNTVNDEPVHLQVKNARINLQYLYRTNCGVNFAVNGEHSSYYGFHLLEYEHPFGTKNKSSEYHVNGTDETVINRLNVEPKDITLTIKIEGCYIEKTIPQVDKLVEMFTNERELNSNKPIPKTIVFSDMKDRNFYFVRVDEIDVDFQGATAKCKVKLDLPDGTSFDAVPTVTGPAGQVSSTISVKPVIYLRSSVAGSLNLTEVNLNQFMEVNSTLIKPGSDIVVDSVNRQVYTFDDSSNKVSLLAGMDMNSTWFRIKGEYHFQSTTGIITSIEYKERR